MIVINNISKIFHLKKKSLHALHNVSFTVDFGVITGVIGLSGAGKSTLLRCVAGLEKIDSGEIIIDKINISDLSPKAMRKLRSDIGVVFQGNPLLMQRNVYDNIAFPLKIKHHSKDQIKKRVSELINLVGLDGKENVFPSQLSGGQCQRVAIARALAGNPKILLLDEITSALDPITTIQIINLLKDIHQKEKVTILLITHEMSIIKLLCNEVVVLNNGEVIEAGNVNKLTVNPQNIITKMLLGWEVDVHD